MKNEVPVNKRHVHDKNKTTLNVLISVDFQYFLICFKFIINWY